MNMKRQISICIILSIIVIILALLYIKVNNENDLKSGQNIIENTQINTEEEKNQSIISSNDYVNYYFCAKNDNGRVAIYDVKTKTLYMETGIETRLLPEEMQKALEQGIFFKTDVELFDFLESYSS